MPTVVSSTPTRGGPNIQAPIGNLVAQRMGSAWAGNGAFSLLNPLYRKRYLEMSAPQNKVIGPGPLGGLGIPAEQYTQQRDHTTPFSTLQGLLDTKNSVNNSLGLVNQRLSQGPGLGFGTPGGTLRKLLLQQGAMY